MRIYKFNIKDKIKHFFVSYVIFILFYVLTEDLFLSFVLSFLIGVIKEIYDLVKRRNKLLESLQDLAANLWGILFALISVYWLKL